MGLNSVFGYLKLSGGDERTPGGAPATPGPPPRKPLRGYGYGHGDSKSAIRKGRNSMAGWVIRAVLSHCISYACDVVHALLSAAKNTAASHKSATSRGSY